MNDTPRGSWWPELPRTTIDLIGGRSGVLRRMTE